MTQKNDMDSAFRMPDTGYSIKPLLHGWHTNGQLMTEALKDYGCSGAVINCPFHEGFTSNPENLRKLKDAMAALDAAGLKYWLYDESGYPSGNADGLTLQGHPELEAKGFFMRRIGAYEPRHIDYALDCEADKIIWAAVYPLKPDKRLHEAFVDYSAMQPVPFTPDRVTIDLEPGQTLYIFSVKRAHEGGQATHNTWSRNRCINIMNAAAVRRFLDVAYEPIVKEIPDAYSRSEAVFTDEPSLMTTYVRGYETWNFALAPWTEGLFERYEAEYGESILPNLPLLFEGLEEGYGVRQRFYRLVGKLTAEAYSAQIQAWCQAHGGIFSGHYLGEESIIDHVRWYGSLLEVQKATGYPGIDVLCCYPEIFNAPATAKFVQMAVRKKGTDGMMVELCPFVEPEIFKQDPLNNMSEVAGELFLCGVRKVNSYFQPDFSKWRGGILCENGRYLSGHVDQAGMLTFNRYIGRIHTLLEGLVNDCSTFIYYNLEEVQARIVPHCDVWLTNMGMVSESTRTIANTLYLSGQDFYYADEEDLEQASNVQPHTLSGHRVRTIIIPGAEVISAKSLAAIRNLQRMGTNVFFLNRLPAYVLDNGKLQPAEVSDYPVYTAEEILSAVRDSEPFFHLHTACKEMPHARYRTKDGRELHFFCNRTREDAKVRIERTGAVHAERLDPMTGDIVPFDLNGELTVPAMHGMFVRFEIEKAETTIPDEELTELEKQVLEDWPVTLKPTPILPFDNPSLYPDKLHYVMSSGGIERTRNGRLWIVWAGAGDNNNAFLQMAWSDDNGTTWTKPKFILKGKFTPHGFNTCIIEANLFCAPDGTLHLFYCQRLGFVDAGRAGVWTAVCRNPDSETPEWSLPRRILEGSLLDKPIILQDGRWLLEASVWDTRSLRFGRGIFQETSYIWDDVLSVPRAANFYLSSDQGGTWQYTGSCYPTNREYDEPRIVQRKDGSLFAFLRNRIGLVQSHSEDMGKTWAAVEPAPFRYPVARHAMQTLPDGRLVLVRNLPSAENLEAHGDTPPDREGLAAFLSGDGGKTWYGGLVIETRRWISYPDITQSPDGMIYVLYDWRREDGELCFARFRVEDIEAGKFVSPDACSAKVIFDAKRY